MATYLELDKCNLLCSCKQTSPLCTLYFCRHCLCLRCPNCVSHEVDSYYCPNCLENMASAEAKMRKHRCGNCFDCPSCGHTLSTRATAVVHAKPDEPGRTTAQKAYFLACGFCRWITRDSGIPDQQQAAGGWQEKISPHFKRISELIDSYHHLAVQEKEDQEWNKFARKRNYMILLERYPVLNPRLRRYCSSSWTTPNREVAPGKKVTIPAAEASSEVPPFDIDEYINKPININKITNIQQRHLAPQIQPQYTSKLEPRPKSLVVKRSMRCRICEHNLCKADFSPSSIKFRINLNALYHVPELRYMIPPLSSTNKASISDSDQSMNKNELLLSRRTSSTLFAMKNEPIIHTNATPGQKIDIILTINNPMHRTTTVSLRQLTAREEVEKLGHLISDKDAKKTDISSESKVDSTSADDTSSLPDDQLTCYSTVDVILPTEELKLAPRNDIMDCDVNSGQSSSDYKDDPKIVAFRRGNKIGIHVALLPKTNTVPTSRHSSLVTVGENEVLDIHHKPGLVPLRAAIYMNFDYKNAPTTLLTTASNKAAVTTSDTKTSEVVTTETATSTTLERVVQPTPADEIKQIQVIALFNFGYMPPFNE
uniref:Dynactin subunit 4 n=1 Tax=Schistosoma japonicum TaxID=6182 RepID=C1LGU5_SCHJA|nr:Dynactin subunit 4 [Schistosoma japonicum]